MGGLGFLGGLSVRGVLGILGDLGGLDGLVLMYQIVSLSVTIKGSRNTSASRKHSR